MTLNLSEKVRQTGIKTGRSRTCKRTLALSTGAVTSVVGIADMNPAAASSGMDNASDFLLGVDERMSFLEAS